MECQPINNAIVARVTSLCLNAIKNIVNFRRMKAYKEHLHSFTIIQPSLNDENLGDKRNKKTMKKKKNAMHRTQKCTLRKRIRHYFYSFSFPILTFSPYVAPCRCCKLKCAKRPNSRVCRMDGKAIQGKNVEAKNYKIHANRVVRSHTSKIGYYVMRVK